MDAMNEALKRKMNGGISIEIKPMASDEVESPEEDLMESPEDEMDEQGQSSAPDIQGAKGPDQMEILKGLADSGSQGRAPSSLGERAAVGARAKMAELMKKKA